MTTLSKMTSESNFLTDATAGSAQLAVKPATARRAFGGMVALFAMGLWFMPGTGWSMDELIIKLVMSVTISLIAAALMMSEA